eukprot:RCo025106
MRRYILTFAARCVAPRVGVRWQGGGAPAQGGPMLSMLEPTASECVKVAQRTLGELDTYFAKSQLQGIRMMQGTALEKMNIALSLLLMAKLQAIKKESGLEGDAGVHRVQALNAKMAMARDSPEFDEARKAERAVLEVIFQQTFGKPVPPSVDVHTARKLAFSMCAAVFDESFLGTVRSTCQSMGDDVQRKNAFVSPKLMEIQTKVFQQNGFNGDDGFLAAQTALLEFAGEPFVNAITVAYNSLLVEALGIKGMPALPKA